MLRTIKVKGKEYPANKITKVLMESGLIEITYNPSAISHDKKIIAKFHECEFISDKDGG